MKKKIFTALLLCVLATTWCFGAWDATKPADNEKLKDTPAIIRAMWDAIALGTDAALLITNAKISPTANIADTKLAQIVTAGKVAVSAITGTLGIANGGTGLASAGGTANRLIGTTNGSTFGLLQIDLASAMITGTLGIANGGTGLTTAGGVSNRVMLTTNGTAFSTGQVDLTSMVTGTLPRAQGGLASTVANNAASGPVFLDADSKLPAVDGSQLTGIASSYSNVLYSWAGADTVGFMIYSQQNGGGTMNYAYYCVSPNGTQEIFRTKFKKIASVSTITVWGRIWLPSGSSVGTYTTLGVNAGGVTGSVNSTTNQFNTPEWKSFSLNVSSLTNGTTYDVIVSLGGDGTGGYARNCMDSIIMIGS